MASIFYWTDSFFIGFFKSSLEVGVYNAAIPIVLLLTFAPNLFIHLFFPLITKEYSRKNFELIKELSKQVGKWIFIINLPIFILMFLFPGTIINALFGAEYSAAEYSLRILSFGLLASSSLIILPSLIQMMGKSKLYFVDMVFALILNIFLNYFLIPLDKIFFIENSIGINGAALATTISVIFLNFLFLLQINHHLSFIPLRRKMFKILIISLIPTFLLFYLKKFVQINSISLILLGSFFIFSYILLILLTGCLDKNDIMILKSFKKRLIKS
jgi:O-antigen/teichoic acid export membrane protein